MNPVAIANALTFLMTATLGVVVLAKGRSRAADVPLLALIAGILVWSGGAVWRAIPVDHEQMMAAHHLVFFGVNTVPVAWLFLALQTTRGDAFAARPLRSLALVLPGLLLYLSFVTNPAHGAFAEIRFEHFARGPLFWGMIAWAFTCSIAGTSLFAAHAHRIARTERRAAIRLLAIGAVPLVVSATYLFRVVPWPMDPTPASLGLSAALLYPLIRTMRTFEDLPLLRRDVIEHLPDAVLITDVEGRLVDLNPAGEALLGDPAREALLDEVLARIASERGVAAARELFEQGHCHVRELPLGDGRRYRLQAARVARADGARLGYFVVLHDRSDEVRAERALRQAQKLDSVGMLAAGVAHEVNNPLAYVRANLSHLERGALAARRAAKGSGDAALLGEMPAVLAETRQGIDRIAAIVSGMRKLSRSVDAGRERLALDGVLDEALRLAALDATPCRVDVDLGADLPPVNGSWGELLQAFLNLLINARQVVAGRSGATIRVRARADADGARVDVEDNGPGIPDELAERIFDPFFTTKGPGEGTGLGLSIAYDLVRDHGGRLEVGASTLGGARFTVRLPAAR